MLFQFCPQIFYRIEIGAFSSKHNDGHYCQTVLFLFNQTRGHFSKKYNLCPHVQLRTVVWLFYGGFGAVASSLLSGDSIQDSFYCGYRYFCTCFLQHLHKVLCCCSGIDLHVLHQSTFISRRLVPLCLYLQTIVCTDERGTFWRNWKLLPRMNQTCGGLQFFF